MIAKSPGCVGPYLELVKSCLPAGYVSFPPPAAQRDGAVGKDTLMSIKVHLYNENEGMWDAFVAGHRGCTNYHRYAWRDVVEKSFQHPAYYLAARNEDNEICGVLPLVHVKSALFGNFLTSLPFFNYGGLSNMGDEISDALLHRSRLLFAETGADHLELRHLGEFESGLVTKQHKVTMILSLEKDEETQWKALDAKVRNQVRKAEKSGLATVTGHIELLDGFYDVFGRNMRDLGTPVYSKTFFRNILQTFPIPPASFRLCWLGRRLPPVF